MLSSHYIFVMIFVIVWSGITIWTIYKLDFIGRRDVGLTYRYGVKQFGVSAWLVSIAIGVGLSWQINSRHSIWYYGAFFAFIMLPICLWGGYAWGKAMSLIFPRPPNV